MVLSGGTMYVDSLDGEGALTLEIYDTVFMNNEALLGGGGIKFSGQFARTNVTMGAWRVLTARQAHLGF